MAISTNNIFQIQKLGQEMFAFLYFLYDFNSNFY